ncbi:metal ABC transporter permease [Hydrogenovibrio halophilus]|uniref:metal ABC transporter permease n=1 Tax=Hydrogenovibrio halophilus TaxID=373391 RepID=UPI00036FC1CE|nr:metal ABC transporter permease [Hydrogenovibrio halophilus]
MMTPDFERVDPDYWQLLVEFWSFSDTNATWVLIGAVLLGMSASVIGTFSFLRKRSLVGDVLAHSALPGVMVAFILSHSNQPLVMFAGALSSSMLGLLLMGWLPKNTKIKPDAAMAITLSFFFAMGLLALSYIQGLPIPGKSGLDKILFGQAAAMLPADLYLLSAVAVVVLVMVWVLFHKLRLVAFSPDYARTLGLPLVGYELTLALLIVSAVVIGLQLVGVVLMAAVLLTPIAAARFWHRQLTVMLGIASLIGALSGAISANISYMAPTMPTGPWMVVVLSMIFLVSFLFAPQRGLLSNLLRQRRFKKQVRAENLLRSFYLLNERRQQSKGNFLQASLNRVFSEEELLSHRPMPYGSLMKGLRELARNGYLVYARADKGWALTEWGAAVALELTRRHRLWETYLVTEAGLSPQDVHRQAEKMEHLLTAEEIERLAELLEQGPQSGKGVKDPHGRLIPLTEEPSS